MAEPKEVSRLAADLRELGFGSFVFVNGMPGGSWEVGIEGAHVRASANFAFRNGKTRRAGGAMLIDGTPAPLAEDMDDLRRIWDEYEGGEAPAPDVPAVLLEIGDPGSQPVPLTVQLAADKVKASAADAGFEVRVGTSGPHWVVGIDLPGGNGLRMVFTRSRRIWDVDRDRPIQVVVDGADRSAEAGTDVSEALALLLTGSAAPPADTPPGRSAVSRRQPGYRDQGVETRRRVVIRELGAA